MDIDKTIQNFITDQNGRTKFVVFTALDCGYCTDMKRKLHMSNDMLPSQYIFGHVEVLVLTTETYKKPFSKTYHVTRYPTIKTIDNVGTHLTDTNYDSLAFTNYLLETQLDCRRGSNSDYYRPSLWKNETYYSCKNISKCIDCGGIIGPK